MVKNMKVENYDLVNAWAKTQHLNYNNFDSKGNFICNPFVRKPNPIVAVFEDHWDAYYKKYKDTIDNLKPNAHIEISKMINCYNKDLGFSLYECKDCHEVFTCSNTCKSRFCSSCGIKYQNNICESVLQTCHKVKHRQMVFTVPFGLRKLFFYNFDACINILFEAVANTLYSTVNGKVKLTHNKLLKNRKFYKNIPGFFQFLHTFGRGVNFIPHIHVLIAETIYNGTNFKNTYFNYETLRKRFQFNLLTGLEKYFGKKSFAKIKNEMYLKYKDGFYVYAEPKIFNSLLDGIKYITRYCARPAIGLKRIKLYDGDNVTIAYNRHEDDQYVEKTYTAFDFITLLLQHLLPKNFKSIRAYGFYQNKSKAKSKVNNLIPKSLHKIRRKLLTFVNLFISSFNKNPLQCPKCGKIMVYQFMVLKGYD